MPDGLAKPPTIAGSTTAYSRRLPLEVFTVSVLLALSATAAPAQTPPEQRAPSEHAGGAADALVDAYSAEVGEPTELDALLTFAADHAPLVQRARRRVGLGEAAITGAEKLLPYNPEVEGEVGVGFDSGLARFEVAVKQRLEIAGERGLRIEAAQRRKQALVAELAGAQWTVHQELHGLYRAGLVDQERVDVEQEILSFTRELLAVAEARFEAGEEPRTSVIVARAELARARQRLVEAWVGYITTLRKLGATAGWADDTPPQPTGELDAPRPAPPKAELLELAYTADPQLAVLEAQLTHAQAERKLAEREVWPDPLLGVGYEQENLGATAVEDKLFFLVGLPLPLWDRNQGEIAAAEARAATVRQAIENRRGVLKSRIFAQAEAVEAAWRQTQIYEQEVLPALTEQLELLQEGFELGELSLLDVMNARDRLLAVQRQYLDAVDAYYTAVSALEAVLGESIGSLSED